MKNYKEVLSESKALLLDFEENRHSFIIPEEKKDEYIKTLQEMLAFLEYTDYQNDRSETIIETVDHIAEVQKSIDIIILELRNRARNHDRTKIQEPELHGFTEVHGALKTLTYGSKEYHEQLESLKSVLEHHYAKNRHHPEHYPNGIDGMDLVDVMEMFCDWYSATKRHNDGNINKSIDHNKLRFNMSDQLVEIFKNTIKYFDKGE